MTLLIDGYNLLYASGISRPARPAGRREFPASRCSTSSSRRSQRPSSRGPRSSLTPPKRRPACHDNLTTRASASASRRGIPKPTRCSKNSSQPRRSAPAYRRFERPSRATRRPATQRERDRQRDLVRRRAPRPPYARSLRAGIQAGRRVKSQRGEPLAAEFGLPPRKCDAP